MVKLGVGKNMVSAIRFWLRAFGLTKSDTPEPIAAYILNTNNGRDPYVEDSNTIWLLHFLLVTTGVASLYPLVFIDYQREKKEFSKSEMEFFHSIKSFKKEYLKAILRKKL